MEEDPRDRMSAFGWNDTKSLLSEPLSEFILERPDIRTADLFTVNHRVLGQKLFDGFRKVTCGEGSPQVLLPFIPNFSIRIHVRVSVWGYQSLFETRSGNHETGFSFPRSNFNKI